MEIKERTITRVDILKALEPNTFRYLCKTRLLDRFIKNTISESWYCKEKKDMTIADGFTWSLSKEGWDFWHNKNISSFDDDINPEIKYNTNKKVLNSIQHKIICDTDLDLLQILVKYNILNKVISNIKREVHSFPISTISSWGSSVNLALIHYYWWFKFSNTPEGFFYWGGILSKVFKEYYEIKNNLEEYHEIKDNLKKRLSLINKHQ